MRFVNLTDKTECQNHRNVQQTKQQEEKNLRNDIKKKPISILLLARNIQK